MTKPNYRISYYVLYGLFILIAIVMVLFYGVGYSTNTDSAGNIAPVNTDLLMFLMYAMLVVCFIAAVGGGIMQFISSFKDNSKKAMQSLGGFLLLIAVLAIAYALSSGEPLKTGEGLCTDTFSLKLSDTCLYSVYCLLSVACLGLILNITGIFKKYS